LKTHRQFVTASKDSVFTALLCTPHTPPQRTSDVLLQSSLRERERETLGEGLSETLQWWGVKEIIFSILKVPRQCPLVFW
jgi:hypothetical protein